MKKTTIINLTILNLFITFFIISCQVPAKEKIRTISGKIITKSEVDTFIKKQQDSLDIKGISIAIINDGYVVYNTAIGIANSKTMEKVNDQTLFEAASISKPVFAWFVMKQVEKGLIDLDTPLFEYMPYEDIDYDDRYKLITARMVLSHTSGFPNWRWFNPDQKLDIKFQPGERFSYSGEGYLYLSKVIANLNGLNLSNLDSLFQQEVAIPLEMEHADFVMNDYIEKHLAKAHVGDSIVYADYYDRTQFSAAGGLHTEAINYSKFIIAVMNNVGLKKESYDDMLKEQVKIPDEMRNKISESGWGLGFAISNTNNGTTYSHGGNNLGYTSGFRFNKEKKIGYVFLTNSGNKNAFDIAMNKFLLED
ncbi:serine hydrolase domain-containing protein [Sunxiuqinia sp. A32]|uniref:serine hydrolase domain-containing protein n=1 Tax=Sunxiuqinia sp. A32 TaxID=3461496 RepID=UPI004045CA4B